MQLDRVTIWLALSAGAAMWMIASAATENLFYGAPLAIGLALLICQARVRRAARDVYTDRDDALPLLQSAGPRLRLGEPVDAAFMNACARHPSRVADRIARDCARAHVSVAPPRSVIEDEPGAMATAITAMIRAVRVNGGDAARPFASFTAMVETDQRLRRRQGVASLHVRAQANGLIGIAAIVIVVSLLTNQETFTFLRDTLDGRRMLTFSLSTMVWGLIAISALTARILDD